MRKRSGFTLIELLVVMAIIAILASIVAPRVVNYIARARMSKAVSEIKGADLALTKMFSDVDRGTLLQMFAKTNPASPVPLNQAFSDAVWGAVPLLPALGQADGIYRVYSDIFYELLRRGNQADLGFLNGVALDPRVKNKLGTTYMDIGTDPWGKPYYFYPGPIRTTPMGFRSCRQGPNDQEEGKNYIYNGAAKTEADKEIRGNPKADGLFGYPASRDLPVYIFSSGADMLVGSHLCLIKYGEWVSPGAGGGDDINNWDNGSGWSAFY